MLLKRVAQHEEETEKNVGCLFVVNRLQLSMNVYINYITSFFFLFWAWNAHSHQNQRLIYFDG